MKYLILLLAFLLSLSAFGYERDTDMQFQLNQASANSLAKTQLGDQLMVNSIRSQKCVYDFSRQGGAIGNITLESSDGSVDGCKIPPKAVIVNAFLDVVTAPTSGGSATLAFSSGKTAADLLAATAKGSITGDVQGIPNWAVANMVKNTGSSDVVPYLTVATAALTAGKINVYIQYVLSD